MKDYRDHKDPSRRGLNFTDLANWPAFEEMVWDRDCKAFSRFLASITAVDRFNKSESAGLNVETGGAWVKKSLPEDWTQNRIYYLNVPYAGWTIEDIEYAYTNASKVPKLNQAYDNQLDYEAMEYSLNAWYYRDTRKAFLLGPVFETVYKCPEESCISMGVTSNPDMTGPGVMVSYYMEAILATLFMIFFTVQQLRHWAQKRDIRAGKPVEEPGRPDTFRMRAAHRIMEAFRGTLVTFLQTGILLAVAMFIAAIVVISEKIEDRKKPSPEIQTGSYVYDVCLAVIACAFAIFPVLAAYTVTRHPGHGQSGAHKKWLGRISLVLIWLLGIAVVYLAPYGEPAFTPNEEDLKEAEKFRQSGIKEDLLAWCDHKGESYWYGLWAAKVLVVGAPLLWLLLVIFMATGFGIPRLAASKRLKVWRPWCRLAIGWVSLMGGWAVLIYLQVLRQKIRNSSGKLGEDGKWGFGQVLAVSMWVPVVLEFIYVLVWGLQDSLSGSLPPEYKAVLRDPSPTFYNNISLNSGAQHGYGYAGAGGRSMGEKMGPTSHASTYQPIQSSPFASPPIQSPPTTNTAYDPHQGAGATPPAPAAAFQPAAFGGQTPPQPHYVYQQAQDPLLPSPLNSPPQQHYQQQQQQQQQPMVSPPQMTQEQMNQYQVYYQQQQHRY